jgi:polar amino acid transport system substrate-binding protein
MRPAWVQATAFLLVAMLAGCASLPRDAEGTWKRVQQAHRIRVGLIESPPWVMHAPGSAAGAEVELVRRMGQESGATPAWFWGSEQRHMEALRNYELDLVIGGLESNTPWKKTIGITKPYITERIVVGMPHSHGALPGLKGRE